MLLQTRHRDRGLEVMNEGHQARVVDAEAESLSRADNAHSLVEPVAEDVLLVALRTFRMEVGCGDVMLLQHSGEALGIGGGEAEDDSYASLIVAAQVLSELVDELVVVVLRPDQVQSKAAESDSRAEKGRGV